MGVNKSNNSHYFRFGLRGNLDAARSLFNDYPMEARNKKIEADHVAAANAILSNIAIGNRLRIRNFSKMKREEFGFSRKIFLDVLNHIIRMHHLGRKGTGYSKSIIEYSNRIKKYIPRNIVHHPKDIIVTNIKGKGRAAVKINTEERRGLERRLKSYHKFIVQFKIDTGLTALDIERYNECETLVRRKPPLNEIKKTDILPVIIYNDHDLTKGGRMYGAFWIGMKKELRRSITIDASKTCDIDGKGMHVQLLYQIAGEPLPVGDMYIYTDEQRKITKNLMLLMMNTSSEFSPEKGRKRVMSTYKRKFGHDHDEVLQDYILELEGFHYKILHLLYKPNWGRLQKTEAAIMLNIMEAAMDENILVLPVHDGCICKIEDRERVLELFEEQRIEAEENKEHLKPVPLEEAKELLEAFHKWEKAA